MILAWLGAALIGLTLGLLGSGGSILTVPVLVYLVGEDSKLAIIESLAIVGLITLFGMVPHARAGRVQWRTALLFGLPGIVGTLLGTELSRFLSGAAQLSLFAVVMLVSATLMLRPAPTATPAPAPDRPVPALPTILQGVGIGVLTGLVGVGGGFLIVPALVLLGGLPMNTAVGTSLVIITLNSLTGFLRHLGTGHADLHWPLIGLFAAVGVVGSLIGARLSERLPAAALRKGFAAFLILIGVYVLSTNISQLRSPPTVTAQLPSPAA